MQQKMAENGAKRKERRVRLSKSLEKIRKFQKEAAQKATESEAKRKERSERNTKMMKEAVETIKKNSQEVRAAKESIRSAIVEASKKQQGEREAVSNRLTSSFDNIQQGVVTMQGKLDAIKSEVTDSRARARERAAATKKHRAALASKFETLHKGIKAARSEEKELAKGIQSKVEKTTAAAEQRFSKIMYVNWNVYCIYMYFFLHS
jgi:chromosome segregation ATPase